jgi:hypothetical protein
MQFSLHIKLYKYIQYLYNMYVIQTWEQWETIGPHSQAILGMMLGL